MSKEKFHTSHHHERRYHKHGIRKPIRQKYIKLDGMDPKFLRNLRRAKKNDPKQNKHIKPKAAKVEKKEVVKGKKDAKAKIPKDKTEAKKEAKKDAKPKA